uniref:C-type lectin domain-containing protein n=1 Tax=Pundamilia nyererei TaxID=303518 RepID=A0A3B4GP01_9CICH
QLKKIKSGSVQKPSAINTPRRCPVGWKMYCKRCFLYVSQALSWAQAQKNCEQMKANLASVHSYREHKFIRRLICRATRQCKPTWLGGSDNYNWTWIDGTNFRYTNWCHGKPSNNYGHCLEMNFSAKKCWNGVFCSCLRPSVCVKKIW